MRHVQTTSNARQGSCTVPRALWAHQAEAVDWLAHHRHALLWDEPGMGKTGEVVATLHRLKIRGPTLVLTGRAQAGFWVDEFHVLWPERRVVAFLSTGAARYNALLAETPSSVYVLPRAVLSHSKKYDVFGFLAQRPWEAIVLDEHHHFRSPKSGMSKALRQLHAPLQWALSATPSDGDPRDYWVILDWLYPHTYGTYWQWATRYCRFQHNGFGLEYLGPRPERLTELAQVLAAHSLRRTKEQCLTGLPTYPPPKVLHVDLSPRERRWYAEMEGTMVTWLSNHAAVGAPTQLAKLTRLKQLATAPEIFEDRAGSSKLDLLVEYVKDRQGQVVVASHFRQVADCIVRRLEAAHERVLTLYGGMADPQTPVRAFNEQAARVLVMTAQTGGEGISLQAHEMILTDLPWSSVEFEQTRHRIHRGNSTYPAVQLTLLLARNTVDDDIYQVLADKQAVNARMMLTAVKKEIRRRNGL